MTYPTCIQQALMLKQERHASRFYIGVEDSTVQQHRMGTYETRNLIQDVHMAEAGLGWAHLEKNA